MKAYQTELSQEIMFEKSNRKKSERSGGLEYPDKVVVGMAADSDPAAAIQKIASVVNQIPLGFVLLFLPPAFINEHTQQEIGKCFGSVPVFGCSSAGHLTVEGYSSNTLLGVGFSEGSFQAESILISAQPPVSMKKIAETANQLVAGKKMESIHNRLCLVFNDGSSKQEDMIMSALVSGMPDVPIFGGSTSDYKTFEKTYVLHEGKFHSESALVLMIDTDMEFKGIGFDHFEPTDKQMVITKADPSERIVYEINGSLAAEEYARIAGTSVELLSSQVFAENPLLVRNKSNYHVRAIQQMLDDGSLLFLSAIDEGLVLTLGSPTDIVDNLASGLKLQNDSGLDPEFILGFDCYKRRLEIELTQRLEEVAKLFRRHNIIGFNTYGEQHLGVHVNQTFVGVAFFNQQV